MNDTQPTASRAALSWIVGILLLFGMMFLTEELASALEIITYVEYDETVYTISRFYDEESSGHHTLLGWVFIILTYTVAIRGGRAVYTGSFTKY
jgi:hypothetical protein